MVKSIRKESSLYFDVHMMVKDPERYVEEFQSCGADMITVHAEACRDLAETVKKIHETGADAGVAVNPDTPLSAVTDVMDQVEMILIMSVYPGFGGQKYIPESTERIRTLRRMLDEKGLEHVHIQVDGGINRATIDEVLAAGANIIVAGSASVRMAIVIREETATATEAMASPSGVLGCFWVRFMAFAATGSFRFIQQKGRIRYKKTEKRGRET